MYGMHSVCNYVPQKVATLIVKLKLRTVYFYL